MSLRRTTRAQSARMPTPVGTGLEGSPPESPHEAGGARQSASLRSRRGTSRRTNESDAAQQVVLREPKGADTPAMQSRFDNSYGNNSFIGLDSVPRRRTVGTEGAFDDEDEEDRRFQRQLRGKPGKYIGQQNLNAALDETKKEAARETHVEPTQTGDQETPTRDQTGQGPEVRIDEATQQLQSNQSSNDRSQRPGSMAPPPRPQGLLPAFGSFNSSSPFRPDSSRSFNHESGLFEDATLRSPVRESAPTRPSNTPQTREANGNTTPRNWFPNPFSSSTLPFARSSLRKATASLLHGTGTQSQTARVEPETEKEASETATGTQSTAQGNLSSEAQKSSDKLTDTELKNIMKLVLIRRGSKILSQTPSYHPLDDLSVGETEEVVTFITATGRSRAAARKLSRTLPKLAKDLAEPITTTEKDQEPQQMPTSQTRKSVGVPSPKLIPSRGEEPQTRPTSQTGSILRKEVLANGTPMTQRRSPRPRTVTPEPEPLPSSWVDRLVEQYMLWSNRISSLFSILGVFLMVGIGSLLLLMFVQAVVAPSDPELGAISNFKLNVAEVLPVPVQQLLTDGDLGPIWNKLKKHDSAITQLHSDDASITKVIEGLKSKLPERIYITTNKQGKPEITQDFWHALRDKIKADDIILTLENAKGQAPAVSDSVWLAVKSRIESDGTLSLGKDKNGQSDTGMSTKDIEMVVDNKLSRSWDNWLSQNSAALNTIVADTVNGIAVSRDDFLKLFEKETTAYKREIHSEIMGINIRVASIQEELDKLRSNPPPAGMTSREVQAMISATINSLLSQGGLDAITSGQIRGHAQSELFNRVNFFSPGSGAVIDPVTTSHAWSGPKRTTDRKSLKAFPASTVLKPWSDASECFCAGADRHGYGRGTNNISVLLSRDIIPQHLVVEHILPGATLDPGAMPRNIEVWAYFEEINLRHEVEVFSQTQFPNTPRERVLNEGFQKIGHFVYERKNYGDGVQVFKMSDELARMGAVTNHVVVRAVDNYGSSDHTCFYRLRMYGALSDHERDEEDRRYESHYSQETVQQKKSGGWFFGLGGSGSD